MTTPSTWDTSTTWNDAQNAPASIWSHLTREGEVLAVMVLWSGIGGMAGLLFAFMLCLGSIYWDYVAMIILGTAVGAITGGAMEIDTNNTLAEEGIPQ